MKELAGRVGFLFVFVKCSGPVFSPRLCNALDLLGLYGREFFNNFPTSFFVVQGGVFLLLIRLIPRAVLNA